MNIIARASVTIYDGSASAPIFPAKAGKPGDEAAAYLSAMADRLLSGDGSRTTCVEPGSAQEELLRRFGYTPFHEAADALMRGMDERMQALTCIMKHFDSEGEHPFTEKHAAAVSIFRMDVEQFTGKRRIAK